MKVLLVRLIISVSGFSAPLRELQDRLSVIAPVRIEIIDLSQSKPVEEFKLASYKITTLKAKDAIDIYVIPPFIDGDGNQFFGGHGSAKFQVGLAAIIPGRDRENLQLLLHETGEMLGLDHDAGCSVMSAIPCGLEFKESDILKARKWLKRKKKDATPKEKNDE